MHTHLLWRVTSGSPLPSRAVFLGLQTNQAAHGAHQQSTPTMKLAGGQPASTPAPAHCRLHRHRCFSGAGGLRKHAEARPRGARGRRLWLNWCGVGGRYVGPLKCNISESGLSSPLNTWQGAGGVLGEGGTRRCRMNVAHPPIPPQSWPLLITCHQAANFHGPRMLSPQHPRMGTDTDVCTRSWTTNPPCLPGALRKVTQVSHTHSMLLPSLVSKASSWNPPDPQPSDLDRAWE